MQSANGASNDGSQRSCGEPAARPDPRRGVRPRRAAGRGGARREARCEPHAGPRGAAPARGRRARRHHGQQGCPGGRVPPDRPRTHLRDPVAGGGSLGPDRRRDRHRRRHRPVGTHRDRPRGPLGGRQVGGGVPPQRRIPRDAQRAGRQHRRHRDRQPAHPQLGAGPHPARVRRAGPPSQRRSPPGDRGRAAGPRRRLGRGGDARAPPVGARVAARPPPHEGRRL